MRFREIMFPYSDAYLSKYYIIDGGFRLQIWFHPLRLQKRFPYLFIPRTHLLMRGSFRPWSGDLLLHTLGMTLR